MAFFRPKPVSEAPRFVDGDRVVRELLEPARQAERIVDGALDSSFRRKHRDKGQFALFLVRMDACLAAANKMLERSLVSSPTLHALTNELLVNRISELAKPAIIGSANSASSLHDFNRGIEVAVSVIMRHARKLGFPSVGALETSLNAIADQAKRDRATGAAFATATVFEGATSPEACAAAAEPASR